MQRGRVGRKVEPTRRRGHARAKRGAANRAEQLESRLLLSVNDLIWNGTGGADQVLFEQLDTTTIRVTETLLGGVAVNNVTVYTDIDGRVIASGLGGDDLLDASALTTAPCTLDGGAGSNTLRGGAADDLLIGGSNGGEGAQASHTIVGGAGDDTIYGNSLTGRGGATGGNHLILGGAGNDTIFGTSGNVLPSNGGEGGQNLIVGGAGSDTIYATQSSNGAEGGHGSILIAGDTTLDEVGLRAVLGEWTSDNPLVEKIENIEGIGSTPSESGSTDLQVGVTVFSDHAADQLLSETTGAANWLFDTAGDDTTIRVKATDIHSDVQVGQAVWINPAGGFWDDAANWQAGHLPGPNDIALLNAGSNTITFRSGTVAVGGIVSASPVSITGGTLEVNGTWQLGGNLSMYFGILRNAQLNSSNGSRLVVYNTANGWDTRIESVTLKCDLDLSQVNGAQLRVVGDLQLNGTAWIGNASGTNYGLLEFIRPTGVSTVNAAIRGAANFIFGAKNGNSIRDATLGTLTIAEEVTISGSYISFDTRSSYTGIISYAHITITGSANRLYSSGNFTNRGVIDIPAGATANFDTVNNDPGAIITSQSATVGIGVLNNAVGGIVSLTGGKLTIGQSAGTLHSKLWSNAGTLLALNAAITVENPFSSSSLGSYDFSGSSMKLRDKVIGNLTIEDGDWVFEGAEFADAVVTIGSSARVTSTSSTFSDVVVTIGSGATVTSTGSTFARVFLNGDLSAPSGQLTLTSGTFDGVTLNANASMPDGTLTIKNGLVLNGTLTIGKPTAYRPLLNVQGAQAITGTGTLVFTNISSNLDYYTIAGSDLTLGPNITLRGLDLICSANLINQGTIIAEGGQLSFTGTSTVNNGTLRATPGSAILVSKSLSNTASGIVTSSGGILEITGLTSSGVVEMLAGSKLTLLGTWQNSGALTVADSTLNLGGNLGPNSLGTFTRLNSTFNLTGTYAGDLTLDAQTGSWVLSGGVLKGGTLTESAGSRLIFTSTGGTLDGMTLAAGLDLSKDNGAKLTLLTSLQVGGDILIGGAGTTVSATLIVGGATACELPENAHIVFGGSFSNYLVNGFAGTTTIPATATISGKRGQLTNSITTGTIRLLGHLNADLAGGFWYLGTGGNFINDGLISAVSATLRIEGTWPQGLGTLNAPTATLQIGGTIIGDLTFDESVGVWALDGGTLKNGTLTQTSTRVLTFLNNRGTFDNLSVVGAVDLRQMNGAALTILNNFTATEPIYVGNLAATKSATLNLGSGSTPALLAPNVEIIFGGALNNAVLNGLSSGIQTIPAGVLIHGVSGKVDNKTATGTLVNHGTILADGSSGRITVGGVGSFQNQSAVGASNAGLLALAGNWSSSGSITNLASTIELGGTTSAVEGLDNVNGTVKLTGTWNGNLTLDDTTGSWQLAGGTLANGRLTQIGPNQLICTAAGGTLDGVAVVGSLDLRSVNGAKLTIKGSGSVGGSIFVGNAAGTNAATLTFGSGSGAFTAPANLDIVLGASTSNTILNGLTGSGTNGTLTIPGSVSIHGAAGVIKSSSTSGTIVNQGTISADVAGGAISLNPTGIFRNEGTIQATGGGVITARFSSANLGVVSVGAGSTINVTGNYSQAATGTTRVEVAGASPGQYGVLKISSIATFAGLLQVAYAGGYAPTTNDALDVITYLQASGTFGTIDGGGFTWLPTYAAKKLTLTAA